jgi:Tfp pilus assembly PilM family ATPase
MQLDGRNICFDFVQAPRSDKGRRLVDVIAAAAKQQDVLEIVEAVERAGCVVKDVTLPLTHYGALLSAEGNNADKAGTSLVIDMGRKSSRFTFFEGSTPKHSRSESRLSEQQMLATVDMTIAVGSGAVYLDPDEAKRVIRHYGIAYQSGADEITGKGMPLFQLHSMLRPYAEVTAAMAQNLISQYVKEYRAPEVRSIFFTGPGAYMKGLAEYVQKALGVPTAMLQFHHKTGDGNEGLALEPQDENDEGLRQVMALALSASQNISLLPKSVVLDRLTMMATRIGTVLFVISLAILAFLYAGLGKQIGTHSEILSKIRRVSAPVAEIGASSEALSQIRREIDWYETAMGEIPPPHLWMGILGDAGRLMPSNMKLNKLAFGRTDEGPIIKIEGEAYAPSDDAGTSAFEYANTLESSPFVDSILDISLEEHHNEKPGSKTTHFKIKFRLREVPAAVREHRSAENSHKGDTES